MFVCFSSRVFNVLDSRESKNFQAIVNDAEAELVSKLVEILVTCDTVRRKTIGVITFYQKQKMLISNKIKAR